MAPPWDDKVWWCWVRSWDESRIKSERRRFTGNTFYYARNKAAVYFKSDPLQIEGEQVRPALGPPSGRSATHDPWSWMKKTEDKNEPERAKDAGGKKPKKRKAKSEKKARKRRGKAARRDP